MSTRLDISQLRGRAPSRRTESSRKWQIKSGTTRAWIALERLPEAVTTSADRFEQWIDALTVEPRPGLAVWEVFERLEAKSARGLGIAGEAVIAARSWVEGRSLGRTSAISRWRETAAAVAMSLRELHDQGRHHGALKPANIVMEGATSATITDLRLSPAPYDDPTRLASIAPYLAPECWEGDRPSPASDIYALGVMLSEFATGRRPLMANGLSGWSKAHTSGAPRTEHLSDTNLTVFVGEMLAKNPADRPTADEAVTRLVELGAEVEAPSISPLTQQVRRAAETCIGRLADSGSTHLSLARRNQPRASRRVAHLVADELQLADKPTVLLEGPTPQPGWPWAPTGGPWATLIELARATSRLRGRELRDISLRGDRQHLETEFTELILEQLPDAGLRVVWHDFDDEIADVREIWRGVVDASIAQGRPLATLTVTDEPSPQAEPVAIEATAAAWDDWRRTTARGDVRRMSSEAWREILSEGAPGIDAMQSALDRQLDTRRIARPRTEPVAGWRERVESLMEANAYREACVVCHTVWSEDEPGVEEDELIEAWVDASTRVSERLPQVEALEEMLSKRLRRDQPTTDAAIDLARIRIAQARPLEALQALNQATPPGGAESARVLRWKAQTNLDAGRYHDAADAAEAGLEELGDQGRPELMRALELILRAARAAAGEPGAAEQLESALAEFGSELGGAGKAQMYRCLARAHSANGNLDDAIVCYRRALEIVESANIDASVPFHRLRLGTAYHRRGQLGLAREQYVRGLEAASEKMTPETRASLHAQLAGIEETLGALDEAERHLWSARDIADRQHLDTILVVCDLLEGDLYVTRGDPERARECYQRALQGRRLTTAHQRAELHLAAAEAALELDDRDSAARHVAETRQLIDEEALDELRPRLRIMRSRVELGRGEPSMSAIEEYRKGLEGALARHDLRYVLRHTPALVDVLEREGIRELLGEVAEVYHEARSAVATGLTRQVREGFEAYAPVIEVESVEPAPSPDPEAEAQQPPAQVTSARRFRRLLGFNEVLFAAESFEALARSALDVAESLLDAREALVLVERPGSSDQPEAIESIGQWFEGNQVREVVADVAREVATVGQPSSFDAASDARFPDGDGGAAPEMLDALPIRDGKGVVGAFVLGVVEDQVDAPSRDLVDAFCHQLALAARKLATGLRLEDRIQRAERARARLEEVVEEHESKLSGIEDGEAAATDRRRTAAIPHASKIMEAFLARLEQTARRQMPVELLGPSGSRRETYARLLHEQGSRRDGPLVVVDCGAFDENSLEVELFGEVTSRYERPGALELADGGTLFLDRIDRASPSIQAKLYRALQSGSFRPLGADSEASVDVRPVAGSAVPLVTLVDKGEFNADLGHWLSAERLEVPPLADRAEDVPLLAADILESMAPGLGHHVRLSADAAAVLRDARWPGGLRQLESVVRAAATLADEDVIDEDTVEALVEQRSASASGTAETRGRKPKATRADVVAAMQRAEEDRTRAAELLDVSERTLYRYLKRYEIR